MPPNVLPVVFCPRSFFFPGGVSILETDDAPSVRALATAYVERGFERSYLMVYRPEADVDVATLGCLLQFVRAPAMVEPPFLSALGRVVAAVRLGPIEAQGKIRVASYERLETAFATGSARELTLAEQVRGRLLSAGPSSDAERLIRDAVQPGDVVRYLGPLLALSADDIERVLGASTVEAQLEVLDASFAVAPPMFDGGGSNDVLVA